MCYFFSPTRVLAGVEVLFSRSIVPAPCVHRSLLLRGGRGKRRETILFILYINGFRPPPYKQMLKVKTSGRGHRTSRAPPQREVRCVYSLRVRARAPNLNHGSTRTTALPVYRTMLHGASNRVPSCQIFVSVTRQSKPTVTGLVARSPRHPSLVPRPSGYRALADESLRATCSVSASGQGEGVSKGADGSKCSIGATHRSPAAAPSCPASA